jgi:hypothetical protein
MTGRRTHEQKLNRAARRAARNLRRGHKVLRSVMFELLGI